MVELYFGLKIVLFVASLVLSIIVIIAELWKRREQHDHSTGHQ